MDKKRRWLVWAALALLIMLIIMALRGVFGGSNRAVTAAKLRCVATQDVTPFGSEILYYDGITLYCLRANGYEHWSYPLGENASFSCSSSMVAAWSGTQLHIIDRDGNSTYNENLSDAIQFARVGAKYVAVVMGGDISPSLVIKDMQGTTVDTEASAYKDLILLDLGFFSDGEFLWTTSMDVYGSVPDTRLHTFRVHVSNSGGISLGDNLVYSVVYAGAKLNVISTRQLRQYDYRGTQDQNGTVLVYGWQLMDAVPSGSEAMLLFKPAKSADFMGRINQLRLIWGKTDRRYALPCACVGAGLYSKRIYAFADDMVYRADLGSRRFTPISIGHLLNGQTVTGFLGILKDGTALLSCMNEVYAVSLL
jgi:hypothetical protein